MRSCFVSLSDSMGIAKQGLNHRDLAMCWPAPTPESRRAGATTWRHVHTVLSHRGALDRPVTTCHSHAQHRDALRNLCISSTLRACILCCAANPGPRRAVSMSRQGRWAQTPSCLGGSPRFRQRSNTSPGLFLRNVFRKSSRPTAQLCTGNQNVVLPTWIELISD